MTNIQKALKFAADAHGVQKYGTLPYVYHLIQVYWTLEEFFPNTPKNAPLDEMFSLAFLHDVMEDTPKGYKDIEAEFGYHIAEGVYYLSKPPKLDGETSKEQKKRYYTKMANRLNFGLIDNHVWFVKMADRIANMREGDKNDMYTKDFQFSDIVVNGVSSIKDDPIADRMIREYERLMNG